MEVFPPDDPQSNEVGNRPTVSQLEQIKAWDDSFANLEKVLQAACEKNDSHQDLNNCSRESTVSSLPETDNSANKPEIKRKWEGEIVDSVESNKQKLKRMNSMILNSGEVTIQLVNSPGENCDNLPISNLLSSMKTDTKTKYDDFTFDMPADKIPSENKNAIEFIKLEPKTEIKVEDSDVKIEKKPDIFSDLDKSSCVKENSFSSDMKMIVSREIKNDSGFTDDLSTESKNEFYPQSDDPLSYTLKEENSEFKANLDSKCSLLTDVPSVMPDSISSVSDSPQCKDSEELLPCNKVENTQQTIEEKKEEKEKKDDAVDRGLKKEDKLSKKKKFERCNIRDIKLEEELDAVTLSAQKEEQERIRRLQEAQMRALQERLQQIEVEKEALSQLFSQSAGDAPGLFDSNSLSETEVSTVEKKVSVKTEGDVLIESSDEDKKPKLQNVMSTAIPAPIEENIIDISSSSSGNESDSDDSEKKDDDIMVLSDEGEEGESAEDPNNSGAHTNDCFNLPDEEGRVLVNVGHPPEDPDIFLAPQIAKVIKPHQIGGIRFLYDNVVENLERYKSSSGFGCILAHSMGLGKTVQVVSFVDVFLRHTPATLVLCIVPINTIQNWKAEFDMWVPPSNCVDDSLVLSGEVRPRDYNIYTLNENFKTMAARASLIAEWRKNGGVLLMGYEMYRMLALRKMPKIPVKKSKRLKKQELNVEPETNEQIKKYMEEMYEHIVIPGPDLVICDEGHRIKNSLASTSMALKSIKTRRRVVLTGYPLQNNLLEYWCMVDFVRPNYLGSRAEFCNMFERPISNGQCIDSTPRDRQLMRFRSHVLHSLLVGFVQRRGHSVLRAVLPKKEEHVLLIRMTPIQRQLYKCFVKDLLYVQQATNPLKLFAVCCKIWNHPDILYKLLQEKKAQEDIDLDIDITMAANSGVAGTNCGIRKRVYQSKSKVMQRSLKALPRSIKSEANFNSSNDGIKSEQVGFDQGNVQQVNDIKFDAHEINKEEYGTSSQSTIPSQNEFSQQSSQPFQNTYALKNTMNTQFCQSNFDLSSGMQYPVNNQSNVHFTSKSNMLTSQQFTSQASSQSSPQNTYSQSSIMDTQYTQQPQNQFSLGNSQHFTQVDSQIQSPYGVRSNATQDVTANHPQSPSQTNFQTKSQSFTSQSNSCSPYSQQTDLLKQMQNSNQEQFSGQTSANQDATYPQSPLPSNQKFVQPAQQYSQNSQQSYSNSQTSQQYSQQQNFNQASRSQFPEQQSSPQFSQQTAGNQSQTSFSQVSNQSSPISEQSSLHHYSSQSPFQHSPPQSQFAQNSSSQQSSPLSQQQFSHQTTYSQMSQQYNQQQSSHTTSNQQSSPTESQFSQTSNQTYSQQYSQQSPEFSQASAHQQFQQQNMQTFSEQQGVQPQFHSSHQSYTDTNQPYPQESSPHQQFSQQTFSQPYLQQNRQQYSQQSSQENENSNFGSSHQFPLQGTKFSSKQGQQNTFSQQQQSSVESIQYPSQSSQSIGQKQACHSPSGKGSKQTKFNQVYSEQSTDSQYSQIGQSTGFSQQQLSQSNAQSFTEQISNMTSQYTVQQTTSLQFSSQMSNSSQYSPQASKQGESYNSQYSQQGNQSSEQYVQSSQVYNQQPSQSSQYQQQPLQNAQQFSQQSNNNNNNSNNNNNNNSNNNNNTQQFDPNAQIFSQQTQPSQFSQQSTPSQKSYTQQVSQNSQTCSQQSNQSVSQYNQQVSTSFSQQQQNQMNQQFSTQIPSSQQYSQQSSQSPQQFLQQPTQTSQQYNQSSEQSTQLYPQQQSMSSQQYSQVSQSSPEYNQQSSHSSQPFNQHSQSSPQYNQQSVSSQIFNESVGQSPQLFNQAAQSSQQYGSTVAQSSQFNQTSAQPSQQFPASDSQSSQQITQTAGQSPQQFIQGATQSFEKSSSQTSQYNQQSNLSSQYNQQTNQSSQQFNQTSQIYSQPSSQAYKQTLPSTQYNQNSHNTQQYNQSTQSQFSQKNLQASQQYSQQSYSQQPSQSPQQQYTQQPAQSPQHFNQPVQSPQQFSQPVPSPQQFQQHTAPSPQQYSQHPVQSPQQFSQPPAPSPQQYQQTTASPQQFLQQPTPSPQQFSQQPAPSPQQFSQPTQSPQQFSQPTPSPQQFSQPTPSPQQFSQPAPSPQQFSQPAPSPQQFSQPAPSPQQFSQPAPSPQHFTQPNQSPQQYSQPVPSPQQFNQPTPSPQPFSQPTPSPQSFSQPSPSPQFSQPSGSSQQFNQQNSQVQYTQQPAPQHFSQQTSQTSSNQQYSHLSSQSQYKQQTGQSSQYSLQQQCIPGAQNQFSNSFSQPSNQSSGKGSFQNEYQSQPSVSTSSQVLSAQTVNQQAGKQTSRGGKAKQSRVKPLSQALLPQTSIQSNMKQPPSFSVQAFQNGNPPNVLQRPMGQQSVKSLQDGGNSLFQPLNTSASNQEGFTLQHITQDTSSTYSAKCPKAILQPVKHQSQDTTQHSQMNSDVLHGETEHKNITNPTDSAVVSFRDRMDSSINYEWAVPIMKDYVLGVLENSHKMMVLFVIIAETLQMGDKLLVFSQSLSTLDLLEQFLNKIQVPKKPDQPEQLVTETWSRNKNYFRLDGSTSAQEREKLINEFNRNDNVSLFLLSTRAGCLGINLVGANRIVVMDASWNPCHDAQAVCRIYRYGQKKQCYIYRLVTDNSLEKRIYDRQVNKQGMSDRVVDELNPESNFTWKDVTTLIQDDEDDGPVQELSKFASSYTDKVLKYLVSEMSPSLSKEPFEHESLLLDRKDLKLTKQEKRLAKQSYEMAKRANMINIRTTYTYLPTGTAGGGQFIINNKQCQWVGGTTIRVLPNQNNSAGGNTRTGTTATPITASPSLMSSLFKQGVMVQKLTMPSNVSIPVLTPGAPPVVIPAGQDVLVLRTPKGVYLRLPDGRIIAVQLPPSLLAKTQFRPNVVTHFRPAAPKGGSPSTTVINTPRGQSIGIIKQTLQCGGTVRYLGPRNAAGSSGHNSSRGSAPEVIDLSDDEEPSLRKHSLASNTSANSSESESGSGDLEKSDKTSALFPGKHITIRKISSNPVSSPTSKEKCDIPQVLSKNKQITILPINPSAQQNRQKFAPQIAQPVRVQQMLLHPQQGKRKPIQKNTTKIQMSPLLSGKSIRPQITITQPTSTHSSFQKIRQPLSVQPSKSVEFAEKSNEQVMTSVKSTTDPSAVKMSDRSPKSSPAALPQPPQNSKNSSTAVSEPGKVHGNLLPPSLAALAVNPSLQITPASRPESSVSEILSQKPCFPTKSLVQSAPTTSGVQNENSQSIHSMKSSLQITPTSRPETSTSDSMLLKTSQHSKSPVQNVSVSSSIQIEHQNNVLSPNKSVSQMNMSSEPTVSDMLPHRTVFHSKSPVPNPSVLQNDQSQNVVQSLNPNLQITPLPRSEQSSISDLFSQPKPSVQSSPQMEHNVLATDSTKTTMLPNKTDNSLQQASISHNTSNNKSSVSPLTNFSDTQSAPSPQIPAHQLQNSLQPSSFQQHLSPQTNNENKQKQQNQQQSIPYSSQPQSLPNTQMSFPSPVSSVSTSQSQHVTPRKRKSSNKQPSKKSQQQHLLMSPNHVLQSQTMESPQPFLHPQLSEHLLPENHFPTFSHHISGSDFTFSNFSSHKAAAHIQHPQPLHPLQHSQEHSLLPHLQHMSHLYPMPPHLAGTSSLPDTQPPAPRAWPVPQPSVSSFHPFSQSSPFFSSGQESSQFSFPSSFPLPPSTLTPSLTQSDSNANVASGSEKSSRISTSDM